MSKKSSLILGMEIDKVCLVYVKKRAAIAQLVERTHGKGEVSGSIPDRGSIKIVIES